MSYSHSQCTVPLHMSRYARALSRIFIIEISLLVHRDLCEYDAIDSDLAIEGLLRSFCMLFQLDSKYIDYLNKSLAWILSFIATIIFENI